MAATQLTWLITGASSGLGKSIASEALKAGNKVVATTRDVSKAEINFPDFSAKGGIWIGLDPAQDDAYDQFAKYSREHSVDVLVNNAGYAFIGGVEDTRLVAPRFFRNFYVALAKSCAVKKRFVTKWMSISTGLFVLFELVCQSCVKRASVTSF